MSLRTASAVTCALGRAVTGDYASASRREWLVTNGAGGFASGTVAGANTRRYHGLLIASLEPPVRRTLLVAKAELCATYRGERYELGANEFGDGVIAPRGFTRIESFDLDRGIPTWRYALADALLEQQIFMAPRRNTSYLSLRLLRATDSLKVELAPLCIYRDYHLHNRGAQPFAVEPMADACTVRAPGFERPIRLSMEHGRFEPEGNWYWNFVHRVELERGLDAIEDLFLPGRFAAELAPHQRVFLVASAEPELPTDGLEVLVANEESQTKLLASLPPSSPVWIRQLARASDQFIVARRVGNRAGTSVIAGYPWFTDWGRDTMIALPGLASVLGRHELAADVLRTFASFIDGGMLPNRFPDGGQAPEYNTADATLWFFQAVREHLEASGDATLAKELLPRLLEIVRAHVAGTRFGIGVDRNDGLLRSGSEGTQLTWMDAKVGDTPITPRIGKPVEINALWLNALHVARDLAVAAGDPEGQAYCDDRLDHASSGFAKFWNPAAQCLYDVIDVGGGSGVDSRIRPNQILAIALPYCPLPPAQMRATVDTCGRELVTSYGLRSLSPRDPAYVRRYEGGAASRDRAYHQGTAWSWLLGPFARAHFRVYSDARLAASFLEPIAEHLREACVGSVSEIFDGDAPHAARGAIAQAWGVAEVLRSWVYLQRQSGS